jgi:hypothetical protein
MMSALEQEIIEKFYQLDVAAQERVRSQLIPPRPAPESFRADLWWARVEALQAQMAARIGHQGTVGALSLLEELREEAS